MSKRGGFPGGMGGFNMNNMGSLMKNVKKMKEDIEKTQADLEQKEFDVTVGGGAVYVKVTGNKVLKEIKLKDVDPEDIEMLEDLILTAVNEALRKVDNEQNAQLGKYNIPGLM